MGKVVATRLAIGALELLLLSGCGPSAQEQQGAKEQADLRAAMKDSQYAPNLSHPTETLVAQGHSLVVYQVLEPTTVHVMDSTAGNEIVSMPVDRNQLVSVSEANGVTVGGQHVVRGPLPSGHQFGISVGVASGESWNSKLQTPLRQQPTLPPAVYVPPTSQPVFNNDLQRIQP